MIEYLYEKKIYACGTLPMHRKVHPQFVKHVGKYLKMGILVEDNHHAAAIQWKDTKIVTALSSANYPTATEEV